MTEVGHQLAALTAAGHHLLPAQRWPGVRHPASGLTVVVGPGGVFLLGTTTWTDLSLTSDRAMLADRDVTDELMRFADLAYRAEAGFAEVGLAPGEVRPVVTVPGLRDLDRRLGPVRLIGDRDVSAHIAAYGRRLSAAQVHQVLDRALALFPPTDGHGAGLLDAGTATGGPPRQPGTHPHSRPDVTVPRPSPAPVEEWMAFLDPAQARLVHRSFTGPSRIRGAAGTGKTVVGLHRAAYLARSRPGKVLLTTAARTSPQVLRAQLGTLAPDVADRVEVVQVHAWAQQLLRMRGVPVHLDAAAARAAFDEVWHRLPPGGWFARPDRRYWRDEITHVIKGRGLTSFQAYAELPRAGRRRPLDRAQRRDVWDLCLAYEEQLRARGIHDRADVVLLAEAELQREPLTGVYSAVLADDAQDLSVAIVRTLHLLVGDAPDGLTLIGDGQQGIHPGAYTLAEAGVSVAGRAVVLDVNHRSTVQIVSYAERLVTGDAVVDIEGRTELGEAPRRIACTGPRPVTQHCRSVAARDRAMITQVRTVLAAVGSAPGDIGVLCTSRRAAERAAAMLHSVGIPVVLLERFDGSSRDAVRVGTVRRATGLEFAHVLLPDVTSDLLPDALPPAAPTARESWDLIRR
ncbi:MAG: AAA family ATPase, partial [Actinobacteria bacterium]|nr:AAA family ATPase [Actinomycetota bacterium]